MDNDRRKRISFRMSVLDKALEIASSETNDSVEIQRGILLALIAIVDK